MSEEIVTMDPITWAALIAVVRCKWRFLAFCIFVAVWIALQKMNS